MVEGLVLTESNVLSTCHASCPAKILSHMETLLLCQHLQNWSGQLKSKAPVRLQIHWVFVNISRFKPNFKKKWKALVHPGRLTWNLQNNHLERKMIFQTSMIMFHVNLPGCIAHPSLRPLISNEMAPHQPPSSCHSPVQPFFPACRSFQGPKAPQKRFWYVWTCMEKFYEYNVNTHDIHKYHT